jgi:ATP-binding cassette subfamily F protein 3
MPKDIVLGYLPQQITYSDTLTVKEEVRQAFGRILNLQQEIDTISHQIAHREDYESDEYAKLINSLTEKNEQLAIFEPDKMEGNIELVLKGLGFKLSDFERPTREFSGGWRMRIELAKILLKRPDVFLLDEPTNHLDIESIQWLENFLRAYKGAVLVISHDRKFLDNLTQRTVEISMGSVYDYKVPYSQYVLLREERLLQQLAAYENQQKMIQDTEKFIERFRYKATKAVQVQSRIKQLDKVDRLEIDEIDRSHIHIKFPPAPRSGTIVVEGNRVSKVYGKHQVLDDIDFIIERGDKVAFIGKNGEGKSTLVKMILEQTDYTGEIKIGHNVEVGYFAQNQELLLDENKSVFETIDDIAVGDVRTKIRDILGAFMFSGETIDKKVQVLSGGERARLAIAQLLLKPYNLLILDEPTNHLDMASKDILKEAIQNFDGTVILVSHDRYFLENLPNKVYEFTDKKVKLHLDSVAHVLQKKIEQDQLAIALSSKNKSQAEVVESDSKAIYQLRKEHDKQIRKAEKDIELLEAEIEKADKRVTELEHQLSQNTAGVDIHALSDEYQNWKVKSQQTLEKWELMNETLEKLITGRP